MGHEGRPCTKKSDCSVGYCVYDDKEQRGICRGNPKGCVELIDEKGNSKKVSSTCFD